MSDKLQVWSCGGGTQSCAIAALIVQGKLPKPDVSVIADTGREVQTTWFYVSMILGPALASVGVSLEIVKATEWSYYHKTGHDIFNKQGTLQIPAYSTLSGTISKLPGYCSSAWKQEPIDRWLRSKHIQNAEVIKWLGYGKEEQRRWVRTMESREFREGKIKLPLVHDVPLNRHECQTVIASMGWPVPAPKSRCWMCPNQSDTEWRDLPKDEFQKAVELEREIHKVDPDAWLHRSCVPLDQVDFSQPEDLFARPCDSGMCFV